nr:hypothetical protein [Lysinibacillus timonensis]
MNKTIMLIVTTLMFFLLSPAQLYASEDRDIQVFGVGAEVKATSEGEFLISTEGNKAEEGFVYTPKTRFASTNILVSLELKGTGTVKLKISETNARGEFIKEQSKVIELSETWTRHDLPFELESTTSQIDVLVLTVNQEQTEFSFRDLQVVEK